MTFFDEFFFSLRYLLSDNALVITNFELISAPVWCLYENNLFLSTQYYPNRGTHEIEVAVWQRQRPPPPEARSCTSHKSQTCIQRTTKKYIIMFRGRRARSPYPSCSWWSCLMPRRRGPPLLSCRHRVGHLDAPLKNSITDKEVIEWICRNAMVLEACCH